MKRDNVIRLKRVIDTDRLSLTAESMELIVNDLSVALSDYFVLSEAPVIKVSPKDGKYEIDIRVSAEALKTFLPVP